MTENKRKQLEKRLFWIEPILKYLNDNWNELPIEVQNNYRHLEQLHADTLSKLCRNGFVY